MFSPPPSTIFPVEIQKLILADVFKETRSADLALPLSSFPQSPEADYRLAALFLDLHISGSAGPSSTLLQPDKCIEYVKDTLVLRATLADALPAWRAALRGVPALWDHIAIPVDDKSWCEEVLDALREALALSRAEPLNILITHAPAQGGEGHVERDDEENERARVAQIMALLMPHVARWRCLNVYTLHYAALPLPTIDFAGNMPVLRELHLRAQLPTPTIRARGATALIAPQLSALTMDAHLFRATCLRWPRAFSLLVQLTLWGPKFHRTTTRDRYYIAAPVMSVHRLLACLRQMRSLRSLYIDGAHLGTGFDAAAEGEEVIWEALAVAPTLTHMRCESLSATVLQDMLEFIAAPVPEPLDIELSPLEDIAYAADYFMVDLEVVDCALPPMPYIKNCTRIRLARIAASEDIAVFLSDAPWCQTLEVEDCVTFFVENLAKPAKQRDLVVPTYHGMRPWLVPRLQRLVVDRCPRVEARVLQWLMRARDQAWASRDEFDMGTTLMRNVTLNGRRINRDDVLVN